VCSERDDSRRQFNISSLPLHFPQISQSLLHKIVPGKHNNKRGMLNRGVVMLHDSARPHTAAATQDLIMTFCWEQLDHPSCNPDLARSDFHVFLHLKTFLGGWRCHDSGVKEAVNKWSASQAAPFYDAGI
jgi:hypothetical protein